MKRILVYLFMSPYLLASINQSDTTHVLTGFRSVTWGVSLSEVKQIETAEYLQMFIGMGVEAISYKDKVANLKTRIDYTFRDNKLSEGAYIFYPHINIKPDMDLLLDFLKNQYGSVNFITGPDYNLNNPWIKENDYGLYLGPAFYWVFKNGFIVLYSEKFKEEITLTILYSCKSIKEYVSENEISLDRFNIKQNPKQ